MKFRVLLTLLCAAVLAAAQEPAVAPERGKDVPLSKVERKGRAPISKDVLRVKLPKPDERQLENGLTTLVLKDDRSPVITVELQIAGAGGLHEPANMPGIASITAQMISEGTRTRNSRQIAEETERLGAFVNFGAGFGSDSASVFASGLKDNMEKWLALAGDMLFNPSFPEEELNRLKSRSKAQLRAQRASPSFLLAERFNLSVYGSHPAARIAPTPESLDAITRDALVKWHAERYVPQNAILGISGNVGVADLKRIEALLAPWKKTDLKITLPANPKPAEAKRVVIVNRPNSVQTSVSMGNIAIGRRDSDYVPLVVANRIFGGGATGRLFMNLREEKGYTYGVYSRFTAVKYPGPWSAGGDLRTEVTEGAMTEFLREINRLRDERVPAAELEEHKRAIVASFALSLERPSTLLGYALTRKIYGLPDDYWETYPTRIMAVTADEVMRVARKYLNPQTLQITAVGDAEKIRSIMEKYGPVEVYDTEGRVVAPAQPSN